MPDLELDDLGPSWRARCGVDMANPPDGMKWAIDATCDPAAERPPHVRNVDVTRTARTYDEDTFLRIVALRDIPEHGVRAGDTGGYIDVNLVTESDHHPAHQLLDDDGACWLGSGAYLLKTRHHRLCWDGLAYGGGGIHGDALVAGDAPDSQVLVSSQAVITDQASVTGNRTQVLAGSLVAEHAQVRGDVTLLGVATGSAVIEGDAVVAPVGDDDLPLYTEHVMLKERRNKMGKQYPIVTGQALVADQARVVGSAVVAGNAQVVGGAVIGGQALATGNALLCTDNAAPEPGDGDNYRYPGEPWWGTFVGGSAVVADEGCVSGGVVGGSSRVTGNGHVTQQGHVTGGCHVADDGSVGGQALCTGGRIEGTVGGGHDVMVDSGVLPAGSSHSAGLLSEIAEAASEHQQNLDRLYQQFGHKAGNVLAGLAAAGPQPVAGGQQGARVCAEPTTAGDWCRHRLAPGSIQCAARHTPRWLR